MIRLRALEKRYGSRRALAGIDLVLERREIVGVVGPDGAGKTTLLRALAGLLEIEAREATVLGHDLGGDVTALKARVGYVPQAFSLHRDLTVEENLRFTARLHRLPEAEFRARAGELLARTGLAPFAERPTGALSGGMKQKLAVANALLPRPALLLLDEPTAGVDVMSRAEIWALLERARAQALVLISTSYLDEAAAADRLLYLEGGRLVAAGTPAELRAAVPLRVYRAWGENARAIARAAKTLPYVEAARATGRFARIEVRRTDAPGAGRVLADLAALAGGALSFVEEAPLDMESTLRALAGGV
ncbi:MAG TPA: ABC transporter ATP-binding protein [Candidatus Elarobacter sp.]|nr:ABC transporter ATP-binding protein [Candidatus Elarobacter sp.]